jgi:hypothetical protein
MTDLQMTATALHPLNIIIWKANVLAHILSHTSLLHGLEKTYCAGCVVATFEVCFQEVPTSDLADITCHP